MPFFAAIRQDEYPATDETQCIAVHIPAGDEYKALLAGFIAFLTDTASYLDPDSAQADGIAATFDEGYSLTNWDGCGIPPECNQVSSELFLSPLNMDVIAGNSVAQTIATAQRFNVVYAQTAAALNQHLRAHRWLAAGDWSYRITAVKNNASGILTFEVTDSDGDQSFITTHDFYNSTAQNNQFFTGGFTIAVDGDTTLSFKSLSKNGSSSNYQQNITCLEMWKYSD